MLTLSGKRDMQRVITRFLPSHVYGCAVKDARGNNGSSLWKPAKVVTATSWLGVKATHAVVYKEIILCLVNLKVLLK